MCDNRPELGIESSKLLNKYSMIFIRRAAWCLFNSLAALIILISPVLAVCPPAPIPNADDLVLRFPSAQGVWTGSSSLMAGNVANTFINVEGVVIYDATDKTLKLCDGTSWQPLSGTTSSSAAAGSIGQIQFNDGSGNLAASSNLFWKNSERRLGIGTNDPNAVLHLNGDITASNPHILLTNNAGGAYSFLATRSGIALKGTTEGTGYNDYYFNLSNTADNEYTGHLHGIIATVAAQGTSSPAVINGLVGRPYLQNAATVPTTVGISGQLYAHGAAATGHVTQAIALEASSIYRGGGSTATFGTTYGLLIRPRLYGDNRYGVYQSATDDTNVFMGKMGIGTTAPASQLHVNGGITLGNDTDTCPGAANAKLGTMRFSGGAFSACLAGGWAPLNTGAGGITALTGDVTASGAGSVAATIANNAITSAKILDGTIATADLANNAVTSAKILDGTIATADMANSAITYAKMQNMTANRLLGRSATAGAPQEITIGAGLALSGTTLSASSAGAASGSLCGLAFSSDRGSCGTTTNIVSCNGQSIATSCPSGYTRRVVSWTHAGADSYYYTSCLATCSLN